MSTVGPRRRRIVALVLLLIAALCIAYHNTALLPDLSTLKRLPSEWHVEVREKGNLPLSSQMAAVTVLDERLREAHGASALRCSDEFGVGMLTAWRAARIDVCSPRHDREASMLRCYVRHAFSYKRMLCVARNVVLHPPPADANDTFTPRLDAQCTTAMRERWLRDSPVAGGDAEYARMHPTEVAFGTEYVRLLRGHSAPLRCARTITHPIALMSFWDGVNLYHSFEQLETVYENMLLTGIDPARAEVAFIDRSRRATRAGLVLLPLYTALFRRVRVLHEHPLQADTCLRHAVLGVHAGASHFSNNYGVSRVTGCSATSPILRSMVDWVRGGVGLSPRMSPQVPCAAIYSTVILASRRPPYARVIPNEQQLVANISAALPRGWTIRSVAFDRLPSVVEQIRLASQTSVLLGVHGAALTHTLFLPRCAAVVEVFYGNRGPSNKHYRNVARWMGVHYRSLFPGFSGPIPAEKLLPQLLEAIRQTQQCSMTFG